MVVSALPAETSEFRFFPFFIGKIHTSNQRKISVLFPISLQFSRVFLQAPKNIKRCKATRQKIINMRWNQKKSRHKSQCTLMTFVVMSLQSFYIPYSFEYNVRILFVFFSENLRKIANINRMRTLIECEYYSFFFFSFFRLECLFVIVDQKQFVIFVKVIFCCD